MITNQQLVLVLKVNSLPPTVHRYGNTILPLLIEVIFTVQIINRSVKLILKADPTRVKTFKTIDHEGTSGWEVISLIGAATGTAFNIEVWVINSQNPTSSADPATFTLTNPGTGFYVTGNNVGTSTNGFGVGITVHIVVGGGGGISQISIIDPGFGYQPGDVQTIDGNSGGGIGR